MVYGRMPVVTAVQLYGRSPLWYSFDSRTILCTCNRDVHFALQHLGLGEDSSGVGDDTPELRGPPLAARPTEVVQS